MFCSSKNGRHGILFLLVIGTLAGTPVMAVESTLDREKIRLAGENAGWLERASSACNGALSPIAEVILAAAQEVDGAMFQLGKEAGLKTASESAEKDKGSFCGGMERLYGPEGRNMPGAWISR